MLKLQFPNPWSAGFSEQEGFNIMPFIAVMALIEKINQKSNKKGLTQIEFNIFVPTLIRFDQVDEYVESILEYRRAKTKINILTTLRKCSMGLQLYHQKDKKLI